MPARLVVVDGPDVGAEFSVGETGGGIGRGEGNVVQLSDLSVSRHHCTLAGRPGAGIAVVDAGSRNRTLVNGQPVTDHLLVDGDVITIGKTSLAYLPPEGGVAVVPQVSRVTLEIPSDHFLRPQAGRAREHLAALARLGDGLRKAGDRGAMARIACEVARDALGADRVLLLLPDSTGRLAPAASATAPGDSAQLSIPRDLVETTVRRGNAVLVGPEGGTGRNALAAPLPGRADADAVEIPAGLLYADRAAARAGVGPAWGEEDLQLVACVAHLTAGSLESLGARDSLTRENRALEERLGGSRQFIGQSPAARALLQFVAKVAPTDSTVLLLGESGCGKEMVASAIHYTSRRAKGPFVCLNCAVLTEHLLESELFGHEKGAFTGATERRLGRFEMADGGTLFFDEIGELNARCQTKLLRVLEERRFERVGGTRSISVDVRVITATNRDLATMVKTGEFREDLYYRLSVIQSEIPPLRARRDDIPALAESFLARLRFQTGRRVTSFAPDAMRALMAHAWPGNVRELRNAIERAVVLGEGDLVRVEDLPPQVTAGSGPVAAAPASSASGARSLKDLEREGIQAALAATRGNKAQAAALLEIDRSTLYKKLKDYGIES
jgi:DNA-binding NtrC family response regulator